ncbi:DUF4198 domain-containing protein [Saccharospirillum impatiens]|uniref:DUF4198 domain-containing protein n=1 Tax=Saccharospirillum impatiens TaxID=169438 RepID=UPI00146EE70A|nr:DUF4198 domain-containing protein [Saccharospirillum impatiens]
MPQRTAIQRLLSLILPALLVLTLNTPVSAHEFWLEPLRYRIDVNKTVQADIKVGQNFKGNTYAYFPNRFIRFELHHNGRERPISSRLGARPAASQAVDSDGLTTLTYESTYTELTYDDPAVFDNFLTLDGLDWVRQAHQNRGLPPSGFTEVFRRFAKSYVGTGNAEGQDRLIGYPLEWRLEDNPYTMDGQTPLTATLFLNETPSPGVLARVFMKTGSNDAEELRLITDENGQISVPHRANTAYLVSSVHMKEPPVDVAEQTGAVWESLWASAVFFRD